MTVAPAAIDRDSASRVLRRVSYSQRFPIGRFVPPVGLLGSSVRGLPELQLALRPEARSLAGVNLEQLADWIEREIGDPAGAAVVRDAVRAAPSYVEACLAVHDRIAERVEAARRVLLAEEGGDPGLAAGPGKE
jgi:hypothetical protein